MSLNNTKNVSFRQANPADWPAVAALLRSNNLPLEGAESHLSNFLLAVDQGVGEILGCAGAELYGEIALVRSVAVTPALHKQGLGKAMLGQLIEQARQRHTAQLYLLTMSPEYFTQLGFKPERVDAASPALRASSLLQGVCPSSATFMSISLQASSSTSESLPIAVLGAGPVGLAAVAKLIARGLPFVALEAAAEVGAHLHDYGHVRLFSSWRYNLDTEMADQLAATGWQAPDPEALPLAGDVVAQVLKPFAALPAVSAGLMLNTRVTAISREGFDKVKSTGRDQAPFVIRAESHGHPIEIRARAVIDATGTWGTPNPLGANGLPARGEPEAAAQIFYGIPDVLGLHRARYAGKRTLVVGAGHSAANALLALADLAQKQGGTSLAWVVRSPALKRVFGGGLADALPARGQLGTALRDLQGSGKMDFIKGLRIGELRREAGGKLSVVGHSPRGEPLQLDGIDEIICATGQRPDLSLSAELRVKLDPWLESTEALGPLIAPNLHSCGSVRPHGHRELSHPESGFYTVGVKSYGRAPTFLMATGYEQTRSVVAALAGDLAAADQVELNLPETGVCSIRPEQSVTQSSALPSSSCCGPTAATAPQQVAAYAKPQRVSCCG